MSAYFLLITLIFAKLYFLHLAPFPKENQSAWVCLHYCLCLLLNYQFASLFNSEAGISVILLCWLSTCLPKLEAKNLTFQFEIVQLQQIQKYIKEHKPPPWYSTNESKYESLKLYTADDVQHCSMSKLNCFHMELKVMEVECENDTIKRIISSLWNNLENEVKSSQLS